LARCSGAQQRGGQEARYGFVQVIPDRSCFAATLYMAQTSTPWRLLAAHELGCGSPATCWRRVAPWATVGVFDALHL
jgi:hypothetical protein